MINIQKKINYIILKNNIILFHNKIQLIEVHTNYTKIYMINPNQDLNQFINTKFNYLLISHNSKFNETYMQESTHNIFILQNNEKQKINYNEDINIELNDNVQYVNFNVKDLFKLHIYKILQKIQSYLEIKKLRLIYNDKINYKFNYIFYNNLTKNTIHYEHLNKINNIEVIKKIIHKKRNKVQFKNFEIINLLQEYNDKYQKQIEIYEFIHNKNIEIKCKFETKIKSIKNNYNHLNLIELNLDTDYIHTLFINRIIEECIFIKSIKEKKKLFNFLTIEDFLIKNNKKQFKKINLDTIKINLSFEKINRLNLIHNIYEKIKFHKKIFENIKINDFLICNNKKKVNHKIKFISSILTSLLTEKIEKIKFRKDIIKNSKNKFKHITVHDFLISDRKKKVNYKIKFISSILTSLLTEKIEKIKFRKDIIKNSKNKFYKNKLKVFKKIKLLTLQNITINKINIKNIKIKLFKERETKFNVQKLIHLKFKSKKIFPNIQHKIKKKKFNDKILNHKINLKIEYNQKNIKIKSIKKKIKMKEFKPIRIKLIKNHSFQTNYLHKNINNISKQLFHKKDLNSSIQDNYYNFTHYFNNINFTPYKIVIQNQLHKEYDLYQHKVNINNYKLTLINRFLKNLEYKKKEIFDFIKLQYNNINISYIKKDFYYNDLNEILLDLENIFDINTYKIYIYDNNLIQQINNNIQNFIVNMIQSNDNIDNIYKEYVMKVFEDFKLIKDKELNNSNKNFMMFNNIKKKNRNRIEQKDLKRRLKKIHNNNNNVFIF